jgi:DNA-directed RNA polymerase subunit RPC12/RpoP
MIKTTYICDHCFKEVHIEKTMGTSIMIETSYEDREMPGQKQYYMYKKLELCSECAKKLAKITLDFIQPPPRKDV